MSDSYAKLLLLAEKPHMLPAYLAGVAQTVGSELGFTGQTTFEANKWFVYFN